VFQPWQSPYMSMDGNPVGKTDVLGLSASGGTDPPDANASPTSSVTRKIKSGDNFWNLENKLGLDHGTLALLNPDLDPGSLKPGSYIWIAQNSGGLLIYPDWFDIGDSDLGERTAEAYEKSREAVDFAVIPGSMQEMLGANMDGWMFGLKIAESYYDAQIVYLVAAVGKGSVKAIRYLKELKAAKAEGNLKKLQELDKAIDDMFKADQEAAKAAEENVVSSSESISSGQSVGLPATGPNLRANLLKAGRIAPPNSAAHHIVAGNSPLAAEARRVLAREGIDLNSAKNGVFLPSGSKYAVSPVTTHSSMHTTVYYENVTARILNAEPGKVGVELIKIRNELINGTFVIKL
jgi:hypothetical protein